MKNTPPIVRNDEETVQHSKAQRRHRKEVHRGDGFPMIAQKCHPSLCWLRAPRSSAHPAQDGAFRSIEAKHRQLAMNARSSPAWILGDHVEDELTHFRSDALPARTHMISRESGPIRCESGTMPSHNGLRLTRINACFHPLQSRSNSTQSNRSEAANCGCGNPCLKTASCCRSARFSNSRSRREQKKRVGKVARNLNRHSMRSVCRASGQVRLTSHLIDLKVDRYFGEAHVDIFTRESLAIEVGQSLNGEDVVRVLNRLKPK